MRARVGQPRARAADQHHPERGPAAVQPRRGLDPESAQPRAGRASGGAPRPRGAARRRPPSSCAAASAVAVASGSRAAVRVDQAPAPPRREEDADRLGLEPVAQRPAQAPRAFVGVEELRHLPRVRRREPARMRAALGESQPSIARRSRARSGSPARKQTKASAKQQHRVAEGHRRADQARRRPPAPRRRRRSRRPRRAGRRCRGAPRARDRRGGSARSRSRSAAAAGRPRR